MAARKPAHTRHPTHVYAGLVAGGKLVAPRLVQLACRRHLSDLKGAAARGLYFDEAAASRAIKFFEYLKHSKGEWAGQPLWLELWQCFIIGSVFGWKRRDGTRRFRKAYIEIPRKNGKSTMAAGVGLYLFIADDEPGAEVYSAATKRDQAKIVWAEAKRMAKASPSLAKRVKSHATSLVYLANESTFIPLGADADTLDGLNVSGAIIDELHAHKTRACIDVIDTGTGARRQPLIFVITTAGTSESRVCRDEHDYCERVLEGTYDDDEQFAFVSGIDEGDSWDDEAVWRKVNPNFGISVSIDDLRGKANKAKAVPALQNSFRQKHLDDWVEQAARAVDMGVWRAGAGPIAWQDMAERLAGRMCWAGLDLSSKIDVTCLGLLFPPENADEWDDGPWFYLPRLFIPEDNIKARIESDRVPFDVWAREGAITLTPGNVVDQNWIKRQVLDDAAAFDLQEVAFDRWNSTKLVSELMNEGIEMVEFGQGFGSMAAPTKQFVQAMVPAKQFCHGGHPVLQWMAGNLAVKIDEAENMKPDKKSAGDRIDGLVAGIMALGRAMDYKKESPPPPPSDVPVV